MPENVRYISKVQLSDGSVYYIKDRNALQASGGTMTGDLEVDAKIQANKLYIMAIEVMTYTPTNVLVEDESTNEIKKRSTDLLLEDIGGYSCDESALTNGVLKLKLGK